MLMSVLTVDIWLFYSKSLSCCVQIRSLLDDGSGALCPPAALAAPCREFSGNCADVEEQFRSVPPEQGGLPEDYECHQFPDEALFLDKARARQGSALAEGGGEGMRARRGVAGTCGTCGSCGTCGTWAGGSQPALPSSAASTRSVAAVNAPRGEGSPHS